jgi:hypothetical protein
MPWKEAPDVVVYLLLVGNVFADFKCFCFVRTSMLLGRCYFGVHSVTSERYCKFYIYNKYSTNSFGVETINIQPKTSAFEFLVITVFYSFIFAAHVI